MQQVLKETSSSEFTLWMVYLNIKQEEYEKADYRTAMLANVIQQGYAKKATKIGTFLKVLSFKKVKPKSKEQYLLDSKRHWFGVAKMSLKGK